MSDTQISALGGSAPVVEPQLGTPEYEAAMAAKGASLENTSTIDPASTPPTEPPARPEWLPENFNTPEDLAKSYKELQAKLSGKEIKPTEEPKDAPPEIPGVNTSKYYTEFEETGSLSETSYTELAKAGISKDLVDNYIAGRGALIEQRTQAGYAEVGGQQNYLEMTQWAKANLTKAEASAFNSQVGGSPEQASLAVRGLYAKYQASTGSQPRLVSGNSSATLSTGGFQSRAQVVQAMGDARYDSDPAYRADVMRKLSATSDSVL